MTEKEYRERPEVNKSTLWEIRKSPAHYKWAVENPSEDTPALKMGRAIHMAVLQPEEFPDTYAVMPDGIDRRTKEGKAAWAAWCEENDGKEVLTKEELETCMTVAKSVLNNSNNMLLWCQTEVPLFWVDDRTGIKCKCRIDALKETDDKFLIIDLKTANDASTKTFTREAVKYGYHVQAAHYINEHYMNPMTTADVAQAVGFSPNYLSRKFRTAAGIGLHEYLVFVRLHHAALELISTHDSITTIALRCGFSDSNYFKDSFKKKYGVTPRDYRKLP